MSRIRRIIASLSWPTLLLLLTPAAGAQTLVATIPLPAHPKATNFALPQEIAIDEANNLIYAPVSYRLHSGPGAVAVIDGASDTLLSTIPVRHGPWGIGFNPGTGKLYVAHQNGGGVAVIDTATDTVVATINKSLRASGIAIDSANNLVYATQENSINLWLIDGATDSQIASFNVGVFRPSLMALDTARNRLYIGNNSGRPIRVFDTATQTFTNSLPAGLQRPTLDLVNDRIYFLGISGDFLAVFDRPTETLLTTVPIDPAPLPSDPPIALAYNPETDKIFISRFTSQTVVVLDAATLTPTAVLPAGSYGIAVNSTTDKIYVADRGSSGGAPAREGKIHVLSDPAVLEVSIDIKPGSDPNSINPRSRGSIPVGIFTTSVADGDALDFDAGDIDHLSLAFGPDAAGIAHAQGHIEDLDGDGDLDLVAHFKTRETGIACGHTEAMMTGELLDGQHFQGTDSIRTTGCSR